MSDPGHGSGHPLSTEQAERRVAHLRDDVARLAVELERRYRRAVELPQRIEARGQEVGEQAVHLLQRNKLPVSAIALAALGSGVLLVLRARSRGRPSARALRLLRIHGRRTLLALRAIDRMATVGM